MARPRQSNPTQNDIAAALGLSQATVAMALSPKHQHKLLPDTVALVQEKARELNYHPQRFARILREGRSRTIGIVYQTGLYHTHHERLKHVGHRIHASNYQTMGMDMSWFDQEEEAVQSRLLEAGVEGVILCSVGMEFQTEWADFCHQRGLPVVSLASTLRGEVDGASADMEEAFYQLTRHHLQQGSRRCLLMLSFHDPGFITVTGEGMKQRVAGYTRAILEAGGSIEADATTREALCLPAPRAVGEDGIIGEILYPEKRDTFDNVMDMARQLTAEIVLAGDLPDSLICSNDEMAAGAMASCLRHGVDVPGSVRISGADDSPVCRLLGVPLTTIRQPSQAMAQWSVDRLVHLIEHRGEATPPQIRAFPCELVVRESTALLPQLIPA